MMSARIPNCASASRVFGPTAHTRAAPKARASNPISRSLAKVNSTALTEEKMIQSYANIFRSTGSTTLL